MEFTLRFPELTFGVHLFYDDMSSITYWKIKGDTITETHEESLKFNKMGVKFCPKYTGKNVKIHNNIIDAFMNDWPTDLNVLLFD